VTRKGNGKVTETVKRLLAIEGRLGTVEHAVVAVEARVGAVERAVVAVEGRVAGVEHEVRELRSDLNAGVGRLLDGLKSLEAAIDRVAEIRPRLDALEVRVDRLERPA